MAEALGDLGDGRGRIEGFCGAGFEALLDAFAANFSEREECGASFCLTVDGEMVADFWGGLKAPQGAPWQQDTISVIFSATKGATALSAHLLVDRGELDLDAPVVEIWPEFAAAGKDKATLRMLLGHSLGIPELRGEIPPGAIYDWDYIAGRIAAEAPFWPPGTRNGYHSMTFGWTVGEVVRRVSGKSLGTFFREEIAEPLGLDFWIGLPEAEEPRVAPVIPRKIKIGEELPPFLDVALNQPGSIPSLFLKNSGDFIMRGCNTREGHAAELPAGNGITNARGLAAMYAPLANGGAAFGVELLRRETIDRMAEVSVASHEDATLMIPTRFSLGFMKSMDNRGLGLEGVIMGSRAFGHVGAGGSLGFADPDCAMSFGYTMNRLGPGLLLNERGQSLVDAAYRALGYASNASGVWTRA